MASGGSVRGSTASFSRGRLDSKVDSKRTLDEIIEQLLSVKGAGAEKQVDAVMTLSPALA